MNLMCIILMEAVNEKRKNKADKLNHIEIEFIYPLSIAYDIDILWSYVQSTDSGRQS